MICFYALFIAIGLLLSGNFQSLPDVWSIISVFLSYNLTTVLVIYLLVEPCVILLVTLFTRYPPQTKLESMGKIDKRDNNLKTALIITCHKSDIVILERTIRSALIHFRPENIHIADNSNESLPPLDLCRMVKALDRRIHYRYSKIGNKTLAQYLACR